MGSTEATRIRAKMPGYIARFDSGWGLLKALANCINGRDFPGIGVLPQSPILAFIVNRLGRRLGQGAYALAGWSETVPAKKIADVRGEDIAQSVIDLYPDDVGPAVMIGSGNGALIHLCAALNAPWLPQTFMIPLRRPRMHPDELIADMEWAREPASVLLKNNPELVLYQMHDPDHDRLMVRRMSYFRFKRRALGDAYSRYLRKRIDEGATIYLIECNYSWSTTQVADRHYFQLGGAGGVTPDEYLYGSERVARFLENQGSDVRKWDAPPADSITPEGEWGFQPEMGDEVIALARKAGGRVVRIVFEDPEDMSPLVADFYRWWYRRRGIPPHHLLTQSFIFTDPYWALRTGSVPFWMVFNGRKSADHLVEYLTRVEPYDYIYIMLLSNGVIPIEGVSIEDWRAILKNAVVRGEFIGVDEDKFPYDFASYLSYNAALQKKIPYRYPVQKPATPEELEDFVREHGYHYRVRFEEVSKGAV